MPRLKRMLIWILAIAAGLLVLLATPWDLGGLSSHPAPVRDYAIAVERIEALNASENSQFNPDCRVVLMTHGQQVQRVIVFVHGYTSCPMQFQALGQQFYDLGYNVLIAPLPHHGLADRMTDEQSRLTAEELAVYADKMVDIAQGLGKQVSMAGISAGGVTTAWAAAYRGDLAEALVISPAFGFKQIPTALTVPEMNMISILPNFYQWWDPLKQIETGPAYAYPRYSSHSLAQIARLGFAVEAAAQRGPPAAHRIVVVLNGNEPSVNNDLTRRVVSNWQQRGGDVVSYEFAADLKLPHDLIGPAQPDQRIDIVYPKLIELLTQ